MNWFIEGEWGVNDWKKSFFIFRFVKKNITLVIACKSFLDKLFKDLLFLNILALSIANNLTLEKYFRPS